jgi:hypothetical protein
MGNTHIFVILDRSGSMESCREATVKGYNEYLEGMKKEQNVFWNLVLFDDQYDVPVVDIPVEKVVPLTRRTFKPRGMTALRDAVCRTLSDARVKVGKKDKGLVVVITDGHENASKEFSTEQMREMIKQLEARKNWTFSYLGANQDAWEVAQDYGFRPQSVANYHTSAAGVGATFRTVGAASANLARSDQMSLNNAFYTKEQKKDIEETK